jgi:hypothetical protein
MTEPSRSKKSGPGIVLLIAGAIFVVVFIQLGNASVQARWAELDRVAKDLGLDVAPNARDIADVFPELEGSSMFYERIHQRNTFVHALQGRAGGADITVFDFGFQGRKNHHIAEMAAVTIVVAGQKATLCPDLEIHPPAVQDNLAS